MEETTLYLVAVTLLGVASSARVKHDALIPPLQLINPVVFNLITVVASLAGFGMLVWGFFAFGWKLPLLAFGASVALGSIAVGLAGQMFIFLAYISAFFGLILSAFVIFGIGL